MISRMAPLPFKYRDMAQEKSIPSQLLAILPVVGLRAPATDLRVWGKVGSEQ